MSEIVFSDRYPHREEDREAVVQSFLSFEAEYKPENLTQEPTTIDLSRNCKPNWACIFNPVNRIGKECTPIATKDQLTLVVFEDGFFNIYRNEDLSQSPVYGNTKGSDNNVS